MEREDGGEASGVGVIEAWLEEHRPLYQLVTRHPFLLSIRNGSVDLSSFKKWLEQDYIFVREFVPFVASVLTKAWKASKEENDMETLLGGLAALNDEISWFKKEASKWDVSLVNVNREKSNEDYCQFLQRLTQPEVDYTIAIVAFWAIETVYQQSFAFCLEEGSNTPQELIETCLRWGNADFGQYCYSLRNIANRQLNVVPEDVVRQAKTAFLSILEHEFKFWDMSNLRQ